MQKDSQLENEYQNRLDARYDELKWLYCEIYNNNMDCFHFLMTSMYDYYEKRKVTLKTLDRIRENNENWYKGNDILGMMMYSDSFAGTLSGVQKKIPYIKSCGVNYLHLMPLLDSPKGRDDGGYAVADFRKVKPELGTIQDLEELTDSCHKEGISCCLDFVMNHTSEDHEWAVAAKNGDEQAKKRYFFFDNWEIPLRYEQTVPQVFPTTAPGNFTELSNGKIVMTTFYPYQWDLNYANPVVFNDMVSNLLFLTNCGIDVIRLDAVPYIWKEMGTNCRNLPKVHTLVRMMRLICEIVCPGVLLLGEVVMEPSKVVPYFGTQEKPECHMLYNVTTMASTWHTIATKDVSLLRRQIDQISVLPQEYIFLNYLRCHDDIGWGLDYEWLRNFGMEEVPHKKFLNDYFTGAFPQSGARGELYNDDPRLGDARMCGTVASLCGLESAIQEGNPDKEKTAVNCIIMLHAWLLTQSGIPVLYSGDEIGQLNDYSYKDNPDKREDSRYLHRGAYKWDDVENSLSQKIFYELRKLEKLRAKYKVFNSLAHIQTINTNNSHVLGIERTLNGERLMAFFNFSDNEQKMGMISFAGGVELLSNTKTENLPEMIPGYGVWWINGQDIIKSFSKN